MVDQQGWDRGTDSGRVEYDSDDDDPARKALQQERMISITYQNSKNMHDQMFRLVETMGREKGLEWETLLTRMHRC